MVDKKQHEYKGQTIVNVEYVGDYYHPFKFTLENGEEIIGA